MNEFSFGRAWTMGLGFFSGAALNHAMLLLGLGVLLPVALQLLLFGGPAGMTNPVSLDGDGSSSPAVTLGRLAGFALQSVSFFASWRLGFGRGETLRGALVYGLLAGLMVSLGLGVALAAAAAVFGLISASLAAFAVLVVFVGLFAIAWTAFAALLAMAACAGFVLALAIGLMTGNLNLAATMFGGNGFTGSILVAAALVLLWLAGRLSCTTVLMAEWKSFNLLAAMRESWRLTWDDEWRIMRYLALAGLAMAIAMAAAIALAGAGLAATLRGASPPLGGIGAAILFTAVSMPLAYLSVLVPAGIYRELSPADVAAAEVFA